MPRLKIVLLVLLLLALAGSFFFQNNLQSFYDNLGNHVENFQKSDLANLLNEIKREILTSGPLRIGGKANSVILTEAQIIAQTNLQRRENGDLPALKENAKLNAAALAKAQDMFALQYFEHNSPSGTDPGELVKKYGYDYIVTGENLILGNFENEKEVVQKWMDSPGHRANILHGRFTEIGVAVVRGTYEGETVWIGVQEFGLPLSTCPAPSAVLEAQINAENAQLNKMGADIEAKKAQINATKRNSKEYNGLIDEYNEMVQEYNARVVEVKKIITQYNAEVTVFKNCVAGK